MTAGWHPDPTGRFGARYFDGTDWTDQVQGADGRETTDALERRSSGLAAPTPAGTAAGASAPGASAPGASAPGASAPGASAPGVASAAVAPGVAPPPAWSADTPAPSSPGWSAVAPGAPAPLAKGTGVLGVAIAGLGWLLAAASLLLFNWGQDTSRQDIADALPSPLPDGIDLADRVSIAYIEWIGFGLLFLVMLGIGAVLLGLLGRDPTALRLVVGALAAVAVVVHAFAVVRALRDSVELGAHVGTLGYLVVIVGLAIGSRSRRLT